MLLPFVAFECYQKTYWKQLFLDLKTIFKIVWKCSVHIFYQDKQLAIAEEDVNYLIFTESRYSDLY